MRISYSDPINWNIGKEDILTEFNEIRNMFDYDSSEFKVSYIMCSYKESDLELAESNFVSYVKELHELRNKVKVFERVIDSVIDECKIESKKYNVNIFNDSNSEKYNVDVSYGSNSEK
jgi:hypothetical protein